MARPLALLLLLLASTTLVTPAASGQPSAFPARIDLPDGFQPEGIATVGEQFFTGSIPTGAVYRGSLRTGKGALLVAAHPDRSAIGMKADRGRLFVAGGGTGKAFVYDAKTGALVRSYAPSGAGFVNDVVVTRIAAWFTDSYEPVLYRVPLGPNGRPAAPSKMRTIRLSGDYRHGSGFNLNGIDATANGRTLVVVQSATGKLFTVDSKGAARTIALANGESVPNGDGILLNGRTLYVVQNQLNVVAKISLAPSLRSGRVVSRISSPGFDVPTTIAELGSRLYAVNARFSTPATPTTGYWITRFRK